jgi:hypothetical protein
MTGVVALEVWPARMGGVLLMGRLPPRSRRTAKPGINARVLRVVRELIRKSRDRRARR